MWNAPPIGRLYFGTVMSATSYSFLMRFISLRKERVLGAEGLTITNSNHHPCSPCRYDRGIFLCSSTDYGECE